jgi:hypothetical protein
LEEPQTNDCAQIEGHKSCEEGDASKDFKRLPHMNIRFTSSLTPEDEKALAPVLIQTVASMLELLPIAYMIRIETSDSQVYQHSNGGNRPAIEVASVHSRLDGLFQTPS